MKKCLLIVAVISCLLGCKTDLSDIEGRITDVENQSSDLKKKSAELATQLEALKKKSEELAAQREKQELTSEELKEQLEQLKAQTEELTQQLEALKNESDDLAAEWELLMQLVEEAQQALAELEAAINYVEPKLLKMEFLASDNPMQLVENVSCEIGGNTVECRILNITSDRSLIPRFEIDGDRVTIAGQEAVSGETQFDFSSPRELQVYAGENVQTYIVTVSSYTGLPTFWVNVSNRADISNNTQYYNATVSMLNGGAYGAEGSLGETNVKIKGMGTITWYTAYSTSIQTIRNVGKNAYTLLFSNDVSMLSEPMSTTWDLITNKGDITMLHNQTAFYMGKISNLDYTPSYHYVDFMLNGRYYGTYMLGDHLDISTTRVDVGSDGFVLNVNNKKSGYSFTINHIEQPISIVEPATPSSESAKYIKEFMSKADEVLFSSNFTDASTGWQQYLDMDSFVDWYLINEIAKNTAGAFNTNCIMNLARGGKLKMGPLWDFEKAFGNASASTPTNGFVIKDVKWYARLFQDPVFVTRVKERFDFFYDNQGKIIDEINNNAQYLKFAIQEDDRKWDTFRSYKTSTTDTWVLYQGSVSSMKNWFYDRMQWLKQQFDAMG